MNQPTPSTGTQPEPMPEERAQRQVEVFLAEHTITDEMLDAACKIANEAFGYDDERRNTIVGLTYAARIARNRLAAASPEAKPAKPRKYVLALAIMALSACVARQSQPSPTPSPTVRFLPPISYDTVIGHETFTSIIVKRSVEFVEVKPNYYKRVTRWTVGDDDQGTYSSPEESVAALSRLKGGFGSTFSEAWRAYVAQKPDLR